MILCVCPLILPIYKYIHSTLSKREKQYRNPKIDFQKKQFSVPCKNQSFWKPFFNIFVPMDYRKAYWHIVSWFKHYTVLYTFQHFIQSLESFRNFNFTVLEMYVCNVRVILFTCALYIDILCSSQTGILRSMSWIPHCSSITCTEMTSHILPWFTYRHFPNLPIWLLEKMVTTQLIHYAPDACINGDFFANTISLYFEEKK